MYRVGSNFRVSEITPIEYKIPNTAPGNISTATSVSKIPTGLITYIISTVLEFDTHLFVITTVLRHYFLGLNHSGRGGDMPPPPVRPLLSFVTWHFIQMPMAMESYSLHPF